MPRLPGLMRSARHGRPAPSRRVAHRIVGVVAGLALLAGVGPALGGGSVQAAGPSLPDCEGVYDDVLTAYRDYADWDRTLVDTIYRVPSTYAPTDLGILGHREAGDEVAVPADELGGAMDDDIEAEFQRALEVGADEGVVDHEPRPRFPRDRRDRRGRLGRRPRPASRLHHRRRWRHG